jgi:hypothetical protein
MPISRNWELVKPFLKSDFTWEKGTQNQNPTQRTQTTMSTSHYSSRPAQNDVGSQTIRIPLPLEYSASRRLRRTRALWLLAAGLVLTLADGVALALCVDLPVVSMVLAALSMVAGAFVTAVALTLVKS